MATRLLKILFEFFYLYVLYALWHSHWRTWRTGCNNVAQHRTAKNQTMGMAPLPQAPTSHQLLPSLRPCHKSKEQIAAAKAVKANKPKCRHNKLAGVMRGTLTMRGWGGESWNSSGSGVGRGHRGLQGKCTCPIGQQWGHYCNYWNYPARGWLNSSCISKLHNFICTCNFRLRFLRPWLWPTFSSPLASSVFLVLHAI